MEDEEMEFLNGIYKKEVTEWDELLGTSLLNQEVILEGALSSSFRIPFTRRVIASFRS